MLKARYALIAVVLLVIISIKLLLVCKVSDKEAITLTKAFCAKMAVAYNYEPWVLTTTFQRLMLHFREKEVVVGKTGDYKLSVDINCNNKEVVGFHNYDLRDQVFKKYNISFDNRKPCKWPPFLPESDAKKVIFSLANKIGLPQNMEFSYIALDKATGTWSATWKRKYNEYTYENDFIHIDVMAVDGEFVSYGKFFLGEPCPTVVKIPKEKAIEEGLKRVYKFLIDERAKKHLRDYVVMSAELKIVQPNAWFGIMTPFYKSKSRLAWVIVYELKDKTDRKLVEDVDFKYKFIFKYDAATGKFVGGDYSR